MLALVNAQAQEKLTFRELDSISYTQYQAADWNELIRTGNKALSEGFDYFYLRMRLGIAGFMLQRYRMAAVHFEEALLFNSADAVALEYLRKCYAWSGMETEAAALVERFPIASVSDKKGSLVKSVSLYAGSSLSEGKEKLAETDIDGEANIYGEANVNGNMQYVTAGIGVAPLSHLRWYLGLTHLQLLKHQRFLMSGTDTLNNDYMLRQQQVLLFAPVRIGKGWILHPGVNLLRLAYKPVFASYDPVGLKYNFKTADTTFINYVLSMKLVKHWPYFSLGGAAAYSALNFDHQFQVTATGGIYPLANLNLYALFSSSSQFEGNHQSWQHKVTAGGRITPSIWLQGSHHFGGLKNAHDENALIVFNTAGNVLFRTTATAFLLLNENVTLMLEYSLIKQEDQYIEYIDYNTFAIKPVQYNNHHLMGGLKWKFSN